jgi:hypothetical protein
MQPGLEKSSASFQLFSVHRSQLLPSNFAVIVSRCCSFEMLPNLARRATTTMKSSWLCTTLAVQLFFCSRLLEASAGKAKFEKGVVLGGVYAFRNSHGHTVRFRPDELERDAELRHATCGARVIKASEVNSLKSEDWENPLLITGMMENWTASRTWTRENFVRIVEHYGVARKGINPWNFSDPMRPDCLDCEWSKRASPSGYRPATDYFKNWGPASFDGDTPVFNEPNAVMLDASFSCTDERLAVDTVVPDIFREACQNQHIAFGALGTGHGIHRHNAAYQAEIAGYKSWFFLPPRTYEGETLGGPPVGYPFSERIKKANTLCGYVPEEGVEAQQMRFCVQGPGELMYTPAAWWHGTCSLDPFTVATGGGMHHGLAKTTEERKLEEMLARDWLKDFGNQRDIQRAKEL